MIGFIKRWRYKKEREKQLRICRELGHFLTWNGTDIAQAGKTVGGAVIPVGPATDWILKCKCGYGELAPVGTKAYTRTFEEGLAMLNQQGDLNAKAKDI